MGAAVFERFPNIRMVLGESGIGWIPYVLDRMDFEFEDQYQDLKLKLKPSEYWRRQCKATFQYDRVGTKLIDEMGIETLMWGSDYPASRRGVAGIEEIHRRAVQPPAGRNHLQDDLRERRQVLRPDQLTNRTVCPAGSAAGHSGRTKTTWRGAAKAALFCCRLLARTGTAGWVQARCGRRRQSAARIAAAQRKTAPGLPGPSLNREASRLGDVRVLRPSSRD